MLLLAIFNNSFKKRRKEQEKLYNKRTQFERTTDLHKNILHKKKVPVIISKQNTYWRFQAIVIASVYVARMTWYNLTSKINYQLVTC